MNTLKQIVDPAFLRKSNYSYVDYDDTELSTVLCFALSKNNADLILHQQRIELHAKNKNADLLFSALVDLFTVLADKGEAYRIRLLKKYQSSLSQTQAASLKNTLTTCLLPTENLNNLKQSIFNYGNQGELLSIRHIQEIQ